ncbi:hypothetical protein [Acinetobacter sp. ANC 4470]
MKFFTILGLVLLVGLTACQKRDTDTSQQDKTTSPHSMDQDK